MENVLYTMCQAICIALKLSDVVFIMLMNVKIPTIICILILIGMKNLMLSSIEHRTVF